jgi:thioesterase domain-containing protein
MNETKHSAQRGANSGPALRVDLPVMPESLAESVERPARRDGTAPVTTVFVLPGLGGDERELAALRNGCSPALNCIPVQFPDWTELYTRAMTLDQLVDHCRAQIDRLAPTGGLRLAGYSFGGTMAYAVAEALTASGRRVDRLGLLDSPAIPFVATTPPSPAARWRRFMTSVRERDVHREIAGTFAGLVMRTGNARLLLALGQLRRFRLPLDLQAHVNKPITCRLRENLLLDLIVRLQAGPPRLDVPAVVFRSTRQHVIDAAPDLGWSKHLRVIRIIHLPGDHHTVIKPENVAPLCKAFVEAMAEDEDGSRMADRGVRELSA